MLDELSIITITYNNPEELYNTYKSLQDFRDQGGSHLIINGGRSVKNILKQDCMLIEEPDNGIYDALNKGIKHIHSKYFMLIHSGDILSSKIEILKEQISIISRKNLDILLNDCTIDFGKSKRRISSKNWTPWMFYFGVQPPHPPIIYKLKSVQKYKYDIKHSIISDFDYLHRIFLDKPKYSKGNQLLINMSAGGKTSSGLSSFFLVNREFAKLKGKRTAAWYLISRPFFKLIQMI